MELLYSDLLETREKARRKMHTLETKNEGILPTIVIAEIAQFTYGLRGKDMAESRYQALIQSGLEIQSLTPRIAQQAGLYKSSHKNLPMGDCIIAATALLNHAKIISDDTHFDCITEIKRVWI
jgi:predicted nucleic acid-binding protein